MLRKIDCVMVFVDDLAAASSYYREVFGLRPLWRDERSVGLGFPETDAEIVLHTNPDLPSRVEVHYLVDDVLDAARRLREKGCTLLVEPFEIAVGRCMVVQDPFGTRLCLLDLSRGPRQMLSS